MDTRDHLLNALSGLTQARQAATASEVAHTAGIPVSTVSVFLRAFVVDGYAVKGTGPDPTFRFTGKVPRFPGAATEERAEDTPDRFAVDIPRLGHAGITDPDVLDEIESEKVWTVAVALRAANAAWGIDNGIDADVREARALMAESRQQVRDRAPQGEHYRAGPVPEPKPETIDVGALDAPQP